MDPVVVEAGTALVKVMATDMWSGAKDVVVRWWRRHHPESADQVGADLDQLHDEVVDAAADEATREALTGEWRARLRRLIASNPELAVELRRLLAEELTPLLDRAGRTTTVTQTATVTGDGNTTIQAGRDIRYP
ncbi:hypothetical protein [Nocardia aurantia]|uniref:Uncharacterized protein n=1 Tax=Nocardia aurantia TaxID=2585199 RepID=A0A7K0DZ51_9NOCA|nr:hypothetical protein [Nocardia aurantia]MQY30838.1 hypothetical protein [Nocardia aurantia]